MARPHIEFVQTQNVDWQPQPDGSSIKLLNADPESGEATMLVQYPAGYSRDANRPDEGAEEFLVLGGLIVMDGSERGLHGYGFLPRGSGLGARHSAAGAVMLVFRYGRDDPNSVSGVAEHLSIDTTAMPWDVSTYDPKLIHLRLARKVLRLGPSDSCRTFLLMGMPHGVPQEARLPPERHDHAEEMFMLQGEMWAPEGCMRQGAYFYRPPNILHGPHVSQTGCLQIMRSPGANRIVTHWSDDLRPLPIGAPYRPVMPEGTPPSWAEPLPVAPAW